MEHEVFIPVPAETLREALRDHARVARCVPGLQQDADASARPLSGRLKVRVGGHTITYRGALTLTERAGAFTAKGEGAEVRGTGATKVSVRIGLTETPGGTTVAFTTTSTPTSEGRLSDVPPSTAETTARRLLDRFAAALAKPGAGPDRVAGDDAGSAGADRAAGRGSGVSGPDVGEPGSDAGSGVGPDGRGTAATADASDAGPQASGASGGGHGRDGVSADEPSVGADAVPDRDGADAAHTAEADDRAGGADRAAGRGSATSGGDGQDVGEPGSDAGPQAADAPGGGDGPNVASADESSEGAAARPDATRADGPESRGDASAGEEQPGRAGDASGSVPEFDGLELPDDPDSDSDPDLDASAGFGATASGDGDFLVPLEPPAEAAHARRTMIGRSAEEVDHAPPRGRYAPEQGPDSGGAGVALRWVAPAAALAIAGAVVVGRALRRRR
ncbi:SRPBCC family protein [Streptomyces niveus]|uniref:SRPBCC family protein n=1 Tax=Streptomyces niveus TaxID=193462 RepID=UPI0036EA8001